MLRRGGMLPKLTIHTGGQVRVWPCISLCLAGAAHAAGHRQKAHKPLGSGPIRSWIVNTQTCDLNAAGREVVDQHVADTRDGLPDLPIVQQDHPQFHLVIQQHRPGRPPRSQTLLACRTHGKQGLRQCILRRQMQMAPPKLGLQVLANTTGASAFSPVSRT